MFFEFYDGPTSRREEREAQERGPNKNDYRTSGQKIFDGVFKKPLVGAGVFLSVILIAYIVYGVYQYGTPYGEPSPDSIRIEQEFQDQFAGKLYACQFVESLEKGHKLAREAIAYYVSQGFNKTHPDYYNELRLLSTKNNLEAFKDYAAYVSELIPADILNKQHSRSDFIGAICALLILALLFIFKSIVQ